MLKVDFFSDPKIKKKTFFNLQAKEPHVAKKSALRHGGGLGGGTAPPAAVGHVSGGPGSQGGPPTLQAGDAGDSEVLEVGEKNCERKRVREKVTICSGWMLDWFDCALI